ncbi:unnamed protein product [Mytilus coruscus]|uniref:Integrase catalytic domain-containing protein n=1 Tax=Mytilus coruscus TaxID=42192 RepID=A0A6J8EGB6_MYTCO|nr:unnamed protein product [Mytilus coruscus]
MEARYTDYLEVTTGKLKVKWRFVAADITDKIILGIDFLEHFKAIIDLDNYTVQINQDLILAICLGNKEGKISHVYRVTVGRKTVVPPQSMKVLRMEIDRTPISDIVIQPNYELKGLLTPNVVLKIGQQVSTVVRNGSNKFVTLKGGLKFEIGTEIECAIPLTDVNELDRFSDKSLNDFKPCLGTYQAAEADRISDSLTAVPETKEKSSKVPSEHSILSIKADHIHSHAEVSSQNLDKTMSDRVSVKHTHSFKDINELIPKLNKTCMQGPLKKHSNADELSRIPNHQDPCSHYISEIPLNLLPCGGCKYCIRARNQWQTFEEDVDFVVPLTARSVSCTSSVGIVGLTIRLIRNVTSNNSISIMGMPSSYSHDDLGQLQNQDKHLSTIIAWLTLNHNPSKQELQMQSPGVRHLWQCKSQLRYQDSILSYVWEDPVASRILFVTPDSLKDELLRCCHDLRSSGHLGQDKTLSKLRKTAYWYKMSTDCKIYVSSCHVCNRQKKACRKARADLGQYHSGVPFERIHMDILGPLPLTKMGNKYILVILYQFTKWIECCALPNQHAETIARAFMDSTISRFGCPLEIHTDQGKNIDGNVIRQLCELLEITNTRTTAYHPASNGQVERYIRTLAQMIRCFTQKRQDSWDVHLQQLTGAIRAIENRQRIHPKFYGFWQRKYATY